jgi:hypothetical protein
MKQPTGLQTPADLEDKENFIWQSLMTAIVEHQLPPGSKLPEEALADVFGVSRTGIQGPDAPCDGANGHDDAQTWCIRRQTGYRRIESDLRLPAK